MRFILANLQKNCRIRLNYFKADSLFKNNLHIKTEPVTDGADTKNQTYIVASAPSVTGSVFMQRFKLNFWNSALGRVATCPKPANNFVRCTLVLFSNTWHHYMWPFVKFLENAPTLQIFLLHAVYRVFFRGSTCFIQLSISIW